MRMKRMAIVTPTTSRYVLDLIHVAVIDSHVMGRMNHMATTTVIKMNNLRKTSLMTMMLVQGWWRTSGEAILRRETTMIGMQPGRASMRRRK